MKFVLTGEENGENEGGGARLCDEFSSAAGNHDFPSFSGITDFDSLSPPKPLAGISLMIIFTAVIFPYNFVVSFQFC